MLYTITEPIIWLHICNTLSHDRPFLLAAAGSVWGPALSCLGPTGYRVMKLSPPTLDPPLHPKLTE